MMDHDKKKISYGITVFIFLIIFSGPKYLFEKFPVFSVIENFAWALSLLCIRKIFFIGSSS